MGACFSDVNDTQGAVGVHHGSMDRGGYALNNESGRSEAENAAMVVSGAHAFSSWVEIRLSCKDLKRADAFSKSDPMAVLYEQDRELGRTEVVAASHSPTFTVPFKVLYNFERVQKLRLVIVDIDSGQDPKTIYPNSCDFLGEVTFALPELVTSKEHKLILRLDTRSSHVSMAHVSVEELSAARDVVTAQISAVGIKNVELMSKSDPMLEICKRPPVDGVVTDWQPVFRTEVVPNNLNPVWKPFTLRAVQLNNGDPYRPLLLRVYDFEDTGKHRLLGQVETSTLKLDEAFRTQAPIPLSGSPGKPATGVGCLVVRSWVVEHRPSFLDYISAGVELNFMCAIDFTGSNLNPTNPSSLHYSVPGMYTPYEEALCGVGRVLECYDSDRTYPAFGFGGRRQGAGVSHCFPLNDRPDAVCEGIGGIMQAYRHALSTWELAGPTLFHPVIQRACSIASQPTPHFRYNVLLILTDGEIMDMNDTISAIISASSLPLSILIVGIGSADFANMDKLDSDKTKLVQDGRVAERDIVQFVEFSKFRNNGETLAAELLAELPKQFLAYTRSRKIPLPQPLPQAAAAPTAPPM